MIKKGVAKVDNNYDMDMGDGSYLRSVTYYEVYQEINGDFTVTYVNAIKNVGLITTDKVNYTEKTSSPIENVKAECVGINVKDIDVFINKQLNEFNSKTITWDTPLTEVTQAA